MTMTAERTRPRSSRRAWLLILAVVGGFLLLAVVAAVIIAVALFSSDRVPRQAILELDLERGLVEYVPDDPVATALQGRQTTVRDVVEALHRATDDDRVLGLVARVGGDALGMGQVEELREAVIAFRESGKPAVLYSETFGEVVAGNGSYYLATAFDEVYMQPSGDLGLYGLAAEVPFFGGTLEELDIEPRFGQRYEYKNAANTITQQGFTEAHREAETVLRESMYAQMVAAIADARGMSESDVRERIDNGPFLGEEAVEAGFVDRLAYRDEIYDELKERLDDRAEYLFLSRYLDRAGRPYTSGERVALIYGVGAVVRGESGFDALFGGGSMGSETVARAFREAIEDDDVRAILFRVNSPGGSYVASDAIWRETIRAREAGKPVIVSMGDVAASGGYFVAAAADRIIAHPSTITGSIGVLGGKLLTSELWARLGVNWELIETAEHAGMWSSLRDFSEEEELRHQAWLDRVYDDFTAKVADGRGFTADQLDERARGRIWTGTDALRLGLVDELGGFTTALAAVREIIEVEADADLDLRMYPRRQTLLESIMDRGPDSSQPSAAEAVLLRAVETVRPFAQVARQLGLVERPGPLMAPGYGERW